MQRWKQMDQMEFYSIVHVKLPVSTDTGPTESTSQPSISSPPELREGSVLMPKEEHPCYAVSYKDGQKENGEVY